MAQSMVLALTPYNKVFKLNGLFSYYGGHPLRHWLYSISIMDSKNSCETGPCLEGRDLLILRDVTDDQRFWGIGGGIGLAPSTCERIVQ